MAIKPTESQVAEPNQGRSDAAQTESPNTRIALNRNESLARR
jgi:hypothetical protein